MLAVISGRGQLPATLVRARDEPALICAVEGFLPDDIAPDLTFRLETLGTLLAELTSRGVRQVCFAGAIRRPPVDPTLIDAATWPLVPVLQQAILAGDDAALRAVVGIFETAGFEVLGAHEVAPGLLPEAGVISQAQPDARMTQDALRGAEVLAAMSAADLGQACVTHAGLVLAVEGIYGTDWMLQSLTARPDAGPDAEPAGLLCKAPKRGQDRRVDLPAIGPDTVKGVCAAGLRGIVIEAGGVMVLDLPEVVQACDAAGRVLWVRPETDAEPDAESGAAGPADSGTA